MPKFSGSRERLSNVAVAPSNDTASVSSVSTAASSPISTPPSSPFRDDSGVVVEDFERGTLHFKENLGKRESTSMIPSVPTDNDPIQAIRAALALPDHFDLGQLNRCIRIADRLASPLCQSTRFFVSIEEYATILFLGAQIKRYKPHARFYYSAERQQLIAMTPYAVHESVIDELSQNITLLLGRLGVVRSLFHSTKTQLNSALPGSDPIQVPDLQLTLQRVRARHPAHSLSFPIWLFECAFTQDREDVMEKLVSMTNQSPTVHLVLLATIDDDAWPLRGEQHLALNALRQESKLLQSQFMTHCDDCKPFEAVVVKDVTWMHITRVAFKVFLRDNQGKFDFDSQDSKYVAKGTLHPSIDMQDVDRLLGGGVTRLVDAVIDEQVEAGIPRDHPSICSLRAAQAANPLHIDWPSFHIEFQGHIIESAYQRYQAWYNRDLSKRKGVDEGEGLAVKKAKVAGTEITPGIRSLPLPLNSSTSEPASSIQASSTQGQSPRVKSSTQSGKRSSRFKKHAAQEATGRD